MVQDAVRRFLVNRDFARLWYGQAVSTVGDFVFDTTLTIWIARFLLAGSKWAPAAVSGLMLSMIVAVMVVGPIAGVFVDRWDRRRIMLMTEVVRGVLVGLLTLVMLLPRTALPVWLWLSMIYLVVFVVNSAGQFFNPARFATIGDVVPGEVDRARAFGVGQATTATAAIIGPPVAAPLLVSVGIQWALVLNAASYAVSYFAIRSVRLPAAEPGRTTEGAPASRWRDEFGAGLKMFLRSRFLVVLLSVAVMAQLGTGAINALDVFFLTENLGADSKLLGLMSMAFGVGAVVGALLAGTLVRLIGARNLTWLGLIAGGLMFGAYARQVDFIPAMVLMVLLAVPITALNTGLSPLLLAATPKQYLGRMMAFFNPVNMAASTISVVIAGSIASTTLHDFHATIGGLHIGRIDTIFTVSAVLIAASGAYAAFTLPNATGTNEETSAVPAQTRPADPAVEATEPT